MANQRQRIRFEGLVLDSARDGRCEIGVTLEWCGLVIETSAQGLETPQGRLQAAGEATIAGMLSVSADRFGLELVGVKAVRAFDGWVVVVRVNARADGDQQRLLGSASCEMEEMLPHTSALAVLDATNRFVEPRMPQPPEVQATDDAADDTSGDPPPSGPSPPTPARQPNG